MRSLKAGWLVRGGGGHQEGQQPLPVPQGESVLGKDNTHSWDRVPSGEFWEYDASEVPAASRPIRARARRSGEMMNVQPGPRRWIE